MTKRPVNCTANSPEQTFNTMTNDEAKTKLLELLTGPKYKFRSIRTLSKAIGRNRFDTEELLAEIGARPSRRSYNIFGLVQFIGERRNA